MDKADQLILEQLNKEVPHERTCRVCGGKWQIEQDDLEFFKKFIVPVPRVCPQCSMRQKVAFRNERSLYQRKCDATGQLIIAGISPDKAYKVYEKDYYYSDKWNPLDYGQDFDLNRSFFDQYNQLVQQVPHLNLISINNENCQYVNMCMNSKNCYLISQSSGNEDCMFGKQIINSKNCVDNLDIEACENCYENVFGKNNNNCQFLFDSSNCFDCIFSEGLNNCQNCCLCFNLTNKQYYFRNQPLNKTDYENELKKYQFKQLKREFLLERKNRIVRSSKVIGCQNCFGNNISNSNDCHFCFSVSEAEHGKYLLDMPNKSADCYDAYSSAVGGQLIYNTNASSRGYKQIACFACVGSRNCFYSYMCFDCNDVFGCVNIKNKQYCILNKQYTKEEYEKLIERIKLAMLTENSFGDFFTPIISPYGYNESVALEYFPLAKDEALKLVFKWSDYEAEGKFDGPFYEPLEIKEYFDEQKAKELLAGVLKCEVSGKPFKIMGPELAFYLKHNIPIPKRSPNQRHKDRMALKNPYKLWHRQCMCEENGHDHAGRCLNEFETTYAPERTEKVYCEGCYQKSVL